ncbi:PREDICTED: LOW QUALITY PROTEIN: protein TIPIN homolog [Trachymyrmex cornetzi]|uniref:LOW QUALITY PROTEIN: protein TIPIN homolog n=1 Tax=Trachymyrmex cornetzi TaxID=471704 RepID=UPI00084F299D|nr:PREDICTED: LOW QUALITY PROTEIN: protein TIPIN homolog [Trachymyrmex cornetzi]
MADIPEYEGDDDIIEHYENQESDDERGSRGEAEDATSDNETGTARRIDPSKSKSKSHVVRNPVPKLNTERLTGPNGIQTIEKYFEGFKFYSKGHEKTDLDRIMKRLEHWSYRLFPNYHFDDFLTRLEQLGTKKDLQVFIKKYRLDMITLDDNLITNDSDKDDEDGQEQSAPLDDFDLLITEQIQKQKELTRASIDPPSTSNEDAFDKLLMQSTGTQDSQVPHINTTANEMSDELKVKIERNKQLAIQRRLQRQKEREEEVKRTKFDDMNVETLNESNNLTVHNEMNISQVDSIPSQINENINEAIVVLRQYYQMKNQ